MEEEEEDYESNVNNVTIDTSFQSPVAINAQNKYTNMPYERRLASGILAKTIKEFKGCTIQSTISDSAQYDSDKQVEAINDSEKKVDAINDSDKQVYAINDSDKQVNSINNS